MNNVSLSDIGDILLKIAPTNEQHRIVAKLEKLLAKVDKCKERLEKIPDILKRFRQSVLAAACSGELTEDWRGKHLHVKSAQDLLETIIEEREKKYQEECEIAKKEGKRKPPPFRVNNNPIEKGDLIEIPQKWTWEQLVNLANLQGGVTKGKKFKSKKTVQLPYLRVANVQDGFLDLSEIKEIEALPEDLKKYRLVDGDILFTEGGDRDKLGRGTVWKDNIKDCIHQNHIFRARLYSSRLVPEYISLATKSKYARDYFFDNASQTVNLASINMTTIGNIPLALPPEKEQQEIVRRVETLFKIADQIKARYEKAKAHVDKLTQSILAKAFRGELVPQDSNDEPASELLKRIQAERAQAKDKQSKARKSVRS
jgi:type I restriction enzyme, S subunit